MTNAFIPNIREDIHTQIALWQRDGLTPAQVWSQLIEHLPASNPWRRVEPSRVSTNQVFRFMLEFMIEPFRMPVTKRKIAKTHTRFSFPKMHPPVRREARP